MSNGTIIEIAPGTKYISPKAFERKSAIVGVTLPNSIEKLATCLFINAVI
ncbi:MAG: hypothetical protein PHX09_02620 [Clostridia bacterium]|nr:hypothetical protein [Clostridia bacterium]